MRENIHIVEMARWNKKKWRNKSSSVFMVSFEIVFKSSEWIFRESWSVHGEAKLKFHSILCYGIEEFRATLRNNNFVEYRFRVRKYLKYLRHSKQSTLHNPRIYNENSIPIVTIKGYFLLSRRRMERNTQIVAINRWFFENKYNISILLHFCLYPFH